MAYNKCKTIKVRAPGCLATIKTSLAPSPPPLPAVTHRRQAPAKDYLSDRHSVNSTEAAPKTIVTLCIIRPNKGINKARQHMAIAKRRVSSEPNVETSRDVEGRAVSTEIIPPLVLDNLHWADFSRKFANLEPIAGKELLANATGSTWMSQTMLHHSQVASEIRHLTCRIPLHPLASLVSQTRCKILAQRCVVLGQIAIR